MSGACSQLRYAASGWPAPNLPDAPLPPRHGPRSGSRLWLAAGFSTAVGPASVTAAAAASGMAPTVYATKNPNVIKCGHLSHMLMLLLHCAVIMSSAVRPPHTGE